MQTGFQGEREIAQGIFPIGQANHPSSRFGPRTQMEIDRQASGATRLIFNESSEILTADGLCTN